MNRPRIEELIRILRAPTEEVPNLFGFDMSGWGDRVTVKQARAYYNPDNLMIPENINERKCGTVCCAFGLAGISPTFNKQGLKYDPKEGKWYLNGDDYYGSVFNLAQEFFGLSHYLTQQIFDIKPSWYSARLCRRVDRIMPGDVADVLQLVLDGRVTA